MKIPNWLRRYVDRRIEDKPVEHDRRGSRIKRKEVHERLDRALDDFERTVIIKRDDILKASVNDRQQVVIFSSFREICTSGVQVGMHRVCRHPDHPAANTGVATCDEYLCPKLTMALKGAA